EVLLRVLVLERRANDRVLPHAGRQRHRARDDRARALGGLDDLPCRPIEHTMIERLEPDPDALPRHDCPLAFPALSTSGYYSTISVTTPAPTVRPPSRMAKRSPSSTATGVINSMLIVTLSPGITISVPSFNVTTPVTSVVRT